MALLLLFAGACGTTDPAEKKKAANLAGLGSAMAAEGNLRGALQKLLEASRLDPDNADILQQIALVFRALGEYPLSLKYFQRALDKDPDFPEATNNMGTVYLLMGDYPKAINCFQKAAEDITYETPQFAYNNMGLAYFKMKNYPTAIKSYEQALQISPSYTPALTNLAMVHEAQGDLKKAEAAYREAVLYRPRDARVLLGLSELLLRQNRTEEAKDTLIKVIREDPRSPEGKRARELLAKLQG